MKRLHAKGLFEPRKVAGALEEQWASILIILFLALALNAGQPLRLDDTAFMRMYAKDGPDLWTWAQEYWTTWSGRVLPHAVFVVLMDIGPGVVNFVNALLQAASVYLTAMFVIRKPKRRNGLVWSFLLVLIAGFYYLGTSAETLSVSVFWKTAAVLYVWGYAAMLYALLPMLRLYETGEESPAYVWILSGAACVYAAGFEQSGGFFSAMGFILILAVYLRRKIVPVRALIVWAVGSAATCFFIMSPGNFIRYSEEILFWFPNFETLSFADRLFMGISYTLRYCLTDLYIPVVIVAAGAFGITCIRRTSLFMKLTAALPVIYYGLYPLRNIPMLYDYVFPDSVNGYTAVNWIAEMLGIFHVFLLTFILLLYIDDRMDPVTSAFFAGGLAESIIMGYTPTIIVSMSRCVFFSREILMVPMFYVVYNFLRELSLRRKARDRVRSFKGRQNGSGRSDMEVNA